MKHGSFFHQSKVNVKNIIFLEVWKQGINKVGTEFFDNKADTVDAATDKLQLQPSSKKLLAVTATANKSCYKTVR